VDHHLLHRQLRHRDTPRPPGPALSDPQTPTTAAVPADPPGPAPPLPVRQPPSQPLSAPRVLRAACPHCRQGSQLEEGKGGATLNSTPRGSLEFFKAVRTLDLILGRQRHSSSFLAHHSSSSGNYRNNTQKKLK
jgi:hypothetical protein